MLFFRVIALCKSGRWKLVIKISQKIIIASNFKHGQLVKDDELITWWKFKQKVFFKLLPIVNLGIENFNKDTCISKLAASNFVS